MNKYEEALIYGKPMPSLDLPEVEPPVAYSNRYCACENPVQVRQLNNGDSVCQCGGLI